MYAPIQKYYDAGFLNENSYVPYQICYVLFVGAKRQKQIDHVAPKFKKIQDFCGDDKNAYRHQ